jgi:hypothetical protein
LEEQDLKLIFNAIESGRCLAFLGAGACTAFRRQNGEEIGGLPTGGQLAQWLAEKCRYTNGTTNDLARVAEYFVLTRSGDRSAMISAIQEKINVGCLPRPIHTVLAQLKHIKFIVTSNYDRLIESELDRCGRNLIRHVYDFTNPRTAHFQGTIFPGERDVYLHKMHGTIEQPESLVITQSDYIRYLANLNDLDRGMPEFFRKTIIPQFTLLFLGYGLEDWNLRVIWEGVLAYHQIHGTQQVSYALAKDPQDFQKLFWFSRRVKILDADLTDFAIKLAEHFKLDIPQLNIEKGVQK